MKKLITILLLISLCFSVTACTPEQVEKQYVTVKFETFGGTDIQDKNIVKGTKITAQADPEKQGAHFAGWFEDDKYSKLFDFDQPINSDTTVYAKWNEIKTADMNPILPGYYADPSAYKFGDKYYIFATSDGFNVKGSGGYPVIWESEDFVNWKSYKMQFTNPNYPNFNPNSYYWAPSAMEYNGKYYVSFTMGDYYTMIAEADTPTGEYTILGHLFGETPDAVPKDKTIDSQFFKDDDGKIYLVYLLRENNIPSDTSLFTAICELDPDNLTNVIRNEKVEILPQIYREGQEIFKKDGTYYLLYSEGWWRDASYHVVYATSDNLFGPYTVKETILEATEDESIIGTGHHSTLVDDGNYYIVYHRQFNPFIGPGFRQTAVNKMEFDENGNIKKITPTNEGSLFKSAKPYNNVALGASVYTNDDVDELYKPEYMTDGSYGTLFKTDDTNFPKTVTVDLKSVYQISETELFFEYPNKYYQYYIEYSTDSEHWYTYANRTGNEVAQSPMADTMSVKARFFRIVITGCENLDDAYGFIAPETETVPREEPQVGIFEFKAYGVGLVQEPADRIILNVTQKSLLKGNKLQLNAFVLPTDQFVTFKSDNESVATVDENGLVTAVSGGTAKITVATQTGDVKAECLVTVYDEPMSDHSKLDAKIKEVQQLNIYDYTTITWNNLQKVLARAIEVNNTLEATQSEVDNILTELNAAVSNLVKEVFNDTVILAKNCQRNTGKITGEGDDEGVECNVGDKRDHMTHGAVINLKPGNYQVTIRMKVMGEKTAESDRVANFDLYYFSGGDNFLFESGIYVSDFEQVDTYYDITFDFFVSEPANGIQARLYFDGKMDVKVLSFTFSKVTGA